MTTRPESKPEPLSARTADGAVLLVGSAVSDLDLGWQGTVTAIEGDAIEVRWPSWRTEARQLVALDTTGNPVSPGANAARDRFGYVFHIDDEILLPDGRQGPVNEIGDDLSTITVDTDDGVVTVRAGDVTATGEPGRI